jgi:hypothetical protein
MRAPARSFSEAVFVIVHLCENVGCVRQKEDETWQELFETNFCFFFQQNKNKNKFVFWESKKRLCCVCECEWEAICIVTSKLLFKTKSASLQVNNQFFCCY